MREYTSESIAQVEHPLLKAMLDFQAHVNWSLTDKGMGAEIMVDRGRKSNGFYLFEALPADMPYRSQLLLLLSHVFTTNDTRGRGTVLSTQQNIAVSLSYEMWMQPEILKRACMVNYKNEDTPLALQRIAKIKQIDVQGGVALCGTLTYNWATLEAKVHDEPVSFAYTTGLLLGNDNIRLTYLDELSPGCVERSVAALKLGLDPEAVADLALPRIPLTLGKETLPQNLDDCSDSFDIPQ